MVANGAEAVADGVAEAVDSLPLGKPARKMARRCTLQGARLVWRSIRHMIAFVSMDDLYSLIDQLLLLSTLMAGFAVALMTGSSVGLEEFAQADSFNFRATFIDNELEEDMVTINSHELLWNGQLASACFFTSIATGVSTYLNLNLSRAREDQELGKRFAQVFTFVVLFGYLSFFTGLYYFFTSFQNVLRAAYPSYCTSLLYFPTDALEEMKYIFDSVPKSGTGGDGTGNMIRVNPETWEHCHNRTFGHIYFQTFSNVVVIIFISVIIGGVIINVLLDLRAALREVKQSTDGTLGIDALHECLERIDPSLTKYANEMHAADIHPDQIPHLNFLHLQAIGVTVGDAIRITSATAAPGGSAKRREEEEDLTAGREGEGAASREEEEDTRGRDREQDALDA